MTQEKQGPTVEELRRASDHLLYELKMLMALSTALSSGIVGEGPLHNAMIESFVIHARVIIDFMFPHKPKDGDVLAQQYFDDPVQWKIERGKRPEIFDSTRVRANKELAHLTFARLAVKKEEKPWPHPKIKEEIWRLFTTKFLKNASKDRLGPKCLDLLNTLQSRN